MHITKQLTEINCRFFEAMEALAGLGWINSLSSFCAEHNLSAPRYREMRLTYGMSKKTNPKPPRYKSVEIDALYYLCNIYSISAEWLLTGKGKMFKD